MIKNYLLNPECDTNVYLFISDKERDGVSIETTIDFLNKIFSGEKNLKIIPCHGSPIKAVYNSTSTKEFGEGVYVMGTSDKDYDRKRSDDYISSFSPRGKYYTPGVKVLDRPYVSDPLMFNRDDDYDSTPISSRVVRNDILSGNYDKFLTAYSDLSVPETVLRDYFNKLRGEIKTPVLEGGAAGHINNFQESDDFTFGDIKDMISDLLGSKIKDITEKIDGMNIFASVDMQGRTIFARNKSHLYTKPIYKNDLVKGKNWSDKTKKCVLDAADVISKVFSEIKNAIDVFNYDDKLDSVRYRTWCNFEIVSDGNENVIHYFSNYVSYIGSVTTYYDYNKDVIKKEGEFEPYNSEEIEIIIKNAIKSASDKMVPVKLMPKVILNDSIDLNALKDKWISELEELMSEYNLTDKNTINSYKKSAYRRDLMANAKRIFGGSDYFSIVPLVVERLTGRVALMTFSEPYRKKIKELESNKKLLKRIVAPLDKFFLDFGNDVIKVCQGFVNSGVETKVIKDIKKKLSSAIKDVEESGDSKMMDKLEYLLVRLGDSTSLNSTEGIVFRYKGRVCKLTGSFAVVNQIVNLKRKTSN